MPQIEWYYARGNRQMGPVSSAELKRLATAGEIRPEDLVWREGLTEWASARSVRGLFDEEGKVAGAEEPQPHQAAEMPAARVPLAEPVPAPAAKHPLDMLLDLLRAHFHAHFVEATARVFRACGLYGLLVAMVLVAAFSLIVAIQTKAPAGLLSGVVLLLLLAVLQYAAGKSCDALDRLNRTVGGRLATSLLPDCVALLSFVAGLAALFASVIAAIDTSMYETILFGVAGFIVFGYVAFAALNPETLNIGIAAASEEDRHSCLSETAEEAIGVLLLPAKILLRLVPVALGAGVLCGTLMIGYACYQASFRGDGLILAAMTAGVGRILLIYSAVLPLAAYLVFLLYSLILDLCRAILRAPGSVEPAKSEE